ncbi:MAG: choice-of-anchor C family protein [Methanoregulaceae archaeon]|nr:choice-of-anchor C family protein [Methanoregulaceae archaeon]
MKRIVGVIGVVTVASAANAAFFQNGSFEVGPNPGSFATKSAGDTSITGWVVGGNSIDYIGSYWQASHGSRSIDLSGNNNGSIAQTFDTVIGTTYRLTFDLSGNPDRRPTNPAEYIVNVSAGSLNSNFSYNDLTNTKANMKWKSFTTSFVATSTSTTLSFVAIHPTGAFGPALDNVAVQAVPEPFTMGLGLAAAGAFVRRRMKAAPRLAV